MTLAARLAALERQPHAAQQTAPLEWYEDAAFLARLPAALLRYLMDPTANADWLDVLAGKHYRRAPVVLRKEQRHLLMQAEYRLYDQAPAAARGQAHDRLYDTARPFAAWEDFSGETWIAFWRGHGTTEPTVLAAAGLGDAERALLAAD